MLNVQSEHRVFDVTVFRDTILRTTSATTQREKTRRLFPRGCCSGKQGRQDFFPGKILRRKVERLRCLRVTSETPCSRDIFSGAEIMRRRGFASRCARGAGAIMLGKLFLDGTASLRSDIRLPKLTSARTCPRYETPRSFSCSLGFSSRTPLAPSHPRRKDNECDALRMKYGWARVEGGGAWYNARDSPKFRKNYVALAETRLRPTGLCNELKGFRGKVALRVRFYECH